ncbi:16S rRNA (cytosine(967)-C(5))-methyltransferase RsmB [Sneathiella sp. HT1-7]|uniref:16S rRNA (cytosine(967)-C(5))-methyltransferase RsmB n=1 Tax=Sneathiella sp. HT1-7 TaxID=2887192 RepID=UPI001D1487EA|nr:16S rRNA (cytosine(967)-C(5))-methyltransferase RsmB [Sneathiella sp. HT1-7]MCC3303858.1 16S rRNA (cytosine(967)-C(5))-methyltransferase RsmB [Sneathiella sp. HT1-7]
MTTSPANSRAAAVRLLTRVLQKRQPLEEALDPVLQGFPPRDRALARAITSTALRHLGVIDALIDKMLDRPLPEKALDVRHILRIGITQILYLNIPSHAAVHDTVALVPDRSKHKGLVNALLRRIDRQGEKLLSKIDIPRKNTPLWLWDAWTVHYGEETARRIAEAHLTEAALDISVKSDPKKWAEALDAEILPTGSLRRATTATLVDLPGFEEGDWWVQDAAAAIPAALLGNVAGKQIIDLCAAPGGKTAQFAAAGAEVIALDRSKNRLKRLEQNLERLNLTVTVKVGDAESFTPDQQPDGILLDAPCTSTGTLRRHPDVAYLKSQADVDKLSELQTRLLDHACAILKPGGVLVYSVCSLQSEEGEAQIEALLSRNPAIQREPVQAEEVGGVSDLINSDGDIRTLPYHMGGMDGFYAARLRKISTPSA